MNELSYLRHWHLLMLLLEFFTCPPYNAATSSPLSIIWVEGLLSSCTSLLFKTRVTTFFKICLRFWFTSQFIVSFAFFNFMILLKNQVFYKTNVVLQIRYSSWLFNFKFLQLIFDIVLGLFRVFRFPRARFLGALQLAFVNFGNLKMRWLMLNYKSCIFLAANDTLRILQLGKMMAA